MTLAGALAIAGILLLPRAASAFPSSCSDSCLGTWQNASCDPNGTDVCAEESGPDRIECDEFGNGVDETVYAFSDSGDAIVFGYSDGDAFCCFFSGGEEHLTVATDSGDDLVCLDENDCDSSRNDTCSWGVGYWESTSVIRTFGGNDEIYGSDYYDSGVCDETTGDWCDDIDAGSCDAASGFGDDVEAGAGPDRIVGSLSDDNCNKRYLGEDGNDKIIGTDADETLDGGGGDDVVVGNDGSNILKGGAGEDHLVGGFNYDYVEGGNGDDTVCGSGISDSVEDTLAPGDNLETSGDICAIQNEDIDLYGHCETWRSVSCPAAPF